MKPSRTYGKDLCSREALDVSWAVYVVGPKVATLVATFPADHRWATPCPCYTDRIESFAYHLAHECAANIEQSEGVETFMDCADTPTAFLQEIPL